jgi:hypothetical protein
MMGDGVIIHRPMRIQRSGLNPVILNQVRPSWIGWPGFDIGSVKECYNPSRPDQIGWLRNAHTPSLLQIHKRDLVVLNNEPAVQPYRSLCLGKIRI